MCWGVTMRIRVISYAGAAPLPVARDHSKTAGGKGRSVKCHQRWGLCSMLVFVTILDPTGRLTFALFASGAFLGRCLSKIGEALLEVIDLMLSAQQEDRPLAGCSNSNVQGERCAGGAEQGAWAAATMPTRPTWGGGVTRTTVTQQRHNAAEH
ncbi:hypothetical protein B0H17DRAFT_1142201 [Mycena rosella]|uniref:Uncharacterized protein n=1 Tax=Mycena rosella TaxID=1033263 RepID=A0AAD7D1N7_MYCRO|nr:hypothetical protein B0H17DRAFT_1142201 [Mycena rosella]